ncbi:TIP-1 family-domain-containing protein [Phakopsora pachyrhizi]|nr:TIP-1 family-domain-containing protein [Phakopsora pachyrhizi]
MDIKGSEQTQHHRLIDLILNHQQQQQQQQQQPAFIRLESQLSQGWKTLEDLSDRDLAKLLSQNQSDLQSNFETLDHKFLESKSSLKELIEVSKVLLKSKSKRNETLLSDFIRFEDEHSDHFEPTTTTAATTTTSGMTSKITGHDDLGLIDSIDGQIRYLRRLKTLQSWFETLHQNNDRSNRILNDLQDFLSIDQNYKRNDEEKGELRRTSSSCYLVELKDLDRIVLSRLFELIRVYQLQRVSLLEGLDLQVFKDGQIYLFELIYQMICRTLKSSIEIISEYVGLVLEEEIQWPLPNSEGLDLNSSSTSRILKTFKTVVEFQKKLEGRADMIRFISSTSSDRKDVEDDLKDRGDKGSVISLKLIERSIIIKALVRPINLRFRFHFDSQRSTNRLDKPEWYFDYIIERLDEHYHFINNDLQKLLNLSGQSNINSIKVFTIELIRLVESKLKGTVPQILELKPILSHTIERSIEFDQTILSKQILNSNNKNNNHSNRLERADEDDYYSSWLGTVEVILGNQEWFDVWFEGEKHFFYEACSEIISSSDTWEVNEDDPRPNKYDQMTTNSALRIQDLVEQIKTKYDRLPRLSYRIRFLAEIQFEILELYLSRINGVIEGFERRKNLGGIYKIDSDRSRLLNSGSVGLERLLKIHCSCSWILRVFKIWNDDLFYVELYEDLKSTRIDNRKSSKVDVNESLKSRIFETLNFKERFEGFSLKAEQLIVVQVAQEVLTDLKPYLSMRWDIVPTGADTEKETQSYSFGTSITPALVTTISIWRSSIVLLRNYLKSTLNFKKVLKRICSEIQTEYLNNLILSTYTINTTSISSSGASNSLKNLICSITQAGAEQLKYDFENTFLAFDGTRSSETRIIEESVTRNFQKTIDCLRLLSLKSSSSTVSEEDMLRGGEGVGDPLICFEKVVKIFFDNDEKRMGLIRETIGISETLGNEEVRRVLKRRPECWK